MDAKAIVMKAVADAKATQAPHAMDDGGQPSAQQPQPQQQPQQQQGDSINQQEVLDAIATFRKPPKDGGYDWQSAYDLAPDGAKSYLALIFWTTLNKSKPTWNRTVYLSLRENLLAHLSAEDMNYLVKLPISDALKSKFKAKLASGGQPQQMQQAPAGGQTAATAEGGGNAQ